MTLIVLAQCQWAIAHGMKPIDTVTAGSTTTRYWVLFIALVKPSLVASA